jgi:hypothetical protein
MITMVGRGAHAQNAPVQVSPGAPPATQYYRYQPVGAERTEFVMPNSMLLGGGFLTFAAAYAPSIVVAASSDHDGDKWLYVPLAGPWVDWATRGCGSTVTPTCGVNGFDRAALITSGAVQAIGVAAMVGSLFSREKAVAIRSAKVQLAPATFDSRGQGIMAFGNF